MRREIVAFMLLAMAAGAALDQSYVQTVSRNGTSVIEKTMQITIFSNQLTAEALAKMDSFCKNQTRIICSVDAPNKTITMSDDFASGGYYEFTSEYGLPFVTHTLTISRIPTDRFSSLLDSVLLGANVTSSSGGSSTAIDLHDSATNRENSKVLRQLKANITYTVIMPIAVSEAKCGNVSGVVNGDQASFDLLDVLDQSQPIVVKSDEANLGYITVIAGIVVIVALAISFMGSKTIKRRS
jgi:hypothetical protein